MVVFVDMKSSFVNIIELKMDFKNDLRYQTFAAACLCLSNRLLLRA